MVNIFIYLFMQKPADFYTFFKNWALYYRKRMLWVDMHMKNTEEYLVFSEIQNVLFFWGLPSDYFLLGGFKRRVLLTKLKNFDRGPWITCVQNNLHMLTNYNPVQNLMQKRLQFIFQASVLGIKMEELTLVYLKGRPS